MRGGGLGHILLFVLVDILGFSIVLPLLPYIVSAEDDSAITMGVLMAANPFAQLLAAPILGRLSDRYGRRGILLLCMGGTCVSFLMLAVSPSLHILFLSRVLDGLLGGNISLAHAYIADITTKEERPKSLGLVGATFGVGFIIGPAIGGFLCSTRWRYHAPPVAAFALSLINFVGAWLYLKESLPPEKRNKKITGVWPIISSSLLPFSSLINAFRSSPTLQLLLILRFAYNMTFTTYETMSSIYNKQRFNFSAQQSSYALCFVGIVYAILQGGGIVRLRKLFHNEDGRIISYAIIALTFSVFMWAFAQSVLALSFSLSILALASGALNTLTNSQLTQHAPESETGSTLGVSAALSSLTRILAPLIGGFLVEKVGEGAPGLFVGILLICTWLYARTHGIERIIKQDTDSSSVSAIKKSE